MMEGLDALIVAVAAIVAASVGYAKLFGPYQEELSEGVIEAFGVRSRFKRLVNIGVGLVISAAFTIVAAYFVNNAVVIPAGILAGFLASVEASKVHVEKA